jgi:hypothetical protein
VGIVSGTLCDAAPFFTDERPRDDSLSVSLPSTALFICANQHIAAHWPNFHFLPRGEL